MADVLPFESDQAKAQFETWLPWYVNGRLDTNQQHWMDAYLTSNPGAMVEVNWLRQLQEEIQVTPSPPSADLGLERTLRRIHPQQATRAANLPKWSLKSWLFGSSSPSPWSLKPWRLGGWRVWEFFSSARPSGFAWVASAVIVIQSAMLIHNYQTMNPFATVAVRSQSSQTTNSGAVVIRITFNADTREEDIRLAIAAVDGRIIGGPGRMGDYYIASEIPIDSAMSALRTKTFVVSAIEVANVPPRD